MIEAPNFRDLDWLDHGFGLRDSVAPAGITTVKQIHSRIVIDAAEVKEGLKPEGDALISNHPGVRVGMRTADCVPILLVDTANRAVAAIHAGWRGTGENIAACTVQEMARRWNTRPENLRAAIGPSIGVCCYEVGPEVLARFDRWISTTASTTRDRRLDLPAVNETQLRAEGVGNIWKSGECTFCSVERFFSFRREREQAGRMLSFIGLQNTSGGSRSFKKLGSARKIVRRSGRKLRCACEQVSRVLDFDLVTIDLLLAFDAECRPRHCIHALRRDIFLAVQAHAIRAVRNAGQRAADLPQHIRIPIQIANRKFAFARQLHFIESVGRLLDGDLVPIPERSAEFPLLRFQYVFKFLQFSLGHFPFPRLRTSVLFFLSYSLFCGTDENSTPKFQITLKSGGTADFVSSPATFLFPLPTLQPISKYLAKHAKASKFCIDYINRASTSINT